MAKYEWKDQLSCSVNVQCSQLHVFMFCPDVDDGKLKSMRSAGGMSTCPWIHSAQLWSSVEANGDTPTSWSHTLGWSVRRCRIAIISWAKLLSAVSSSFSSSFPFSLFYDSLVHSQVSQCGLFNVPYSFTYLRPVATVVVPVSIFSRSQILPFLFVPAACSSQKTSPALQKLVHGSWAYLLLKESPIGLFDRHSLTLQHSVRLYTIVLPQLP